MQSIRQIAVQLPPGLERLSIHLHANGLVGWSPEQHPSDGHQSPSSRTSESNHATDWHEAHESPVLEEDNDDSERDDAESSDNTPLSRDVAVDSSNDNEDFHESASEDNAAASNSDNESDDASEEATTYRASGMSDEEQITEISAFIVGEDTENEDLGEAAVLAATQLVSALADSCDSIDAEVIDALAQLNVSLHPVDGGLKLELNAGLEVRSIYIYGDDDGESSESPLSESDGERAVSSIDVHLPTASVHEASSDSELSVRIAVECPVCLSGYSSNARMAALNCRHHMCICCFDRLSRPKQCPICRERIRTHMEVII